MALTLSKIILWTFPFFICCIFCQANSTMMAWPSLGKGHEESCSDTEPCLSIKWLSCQNDTCLCTKQDEMVYDEQNAQCTALAGFSCLRSMPDAKEEKDDESSRYYISCVPHAKCTYPEDECQCEFRYYKTDNNTCVKQLSYNEECRVDEECDQFKFMSCVDGICKCDGSRTYDEKNDKCIAPVGNTCKIIEFDSISEEHYEDDECPDHASCIGGKCTCDDGFKITSDKTCGRNFGDYCDSNMKCSDIQFSCRNQACQCKHPLHQFYSDEAKECISLVSGPCTSVRDSQTLNFTQRCTENALCQETPAYSYCKCKMGYVETNEGKCVKAYGAECNLDMECDNLAPLACIENVCSCVDKLQVFEEKTRKCIGLAGARCWKDINSTLSACTPNSICVKSNPQLSYGKCVCLRGSTATAARTCAKSH